MSSFFSSILKQGKKLVESFSHKKHVGTDFNGNKYFIFQDDPTRPPRRMVDYADTPDPHSIPMLWHSWLRSHRADPPSIDELEAEVKRQQVLANKVQALHVADAKLRMQEIAERRMGTGMNYDDDGYDDAQMMRHLGEEMDMQERLKRRKKL